MGSLLLCLKNNTQVPHTILKNGKHCRSYLEASRAHSESQVSSSMSSQPAAQLTPINATQNLPSNRQLLDSVALSCVMKEINSLKDTHSEVSEATLFNKSSSSTCHIHIRVSEPCSKHDLSSHWLSSHKCCPSKCWPLLESEDP